MVNAKCGRHGEKNIKLWVLTHVLIELNKIKDLPKMVLLVFLAPISCVETNTIILITKAIVLIAFT